jgi:hypothetical protein
MIERKKKIIGRRNDCVIVMNREKNMVYNENIGDSGFVIVRNGEVVNRYEEKKN